MTAPSRARPPCVVTGLGLVSAAGDTPAALLEAVLRGEPLGNEEQGVGRGALTEESEAGSGPGARHARVLVAPIDGFDPKVYLKRKGLRDFSRTSLLACCAASRLAETVRGVPASRIGVAFGTAWGSLQTVIAFERAAHRDGPRFVDPLLFTETVSNVPAGQVAIVFGWSAFNLTVSSGSASALDAIRAAIDLLEDGRAEIVVAGGGDELNLPILRSLAAGGPDPSSQRPIPEETPDTGRVGPGGQENGPGDPGTSPTLFGGEGACWLALEREESARSRGATPLARILAVVRRSGEDGRSDRLDHAPSGSAPPEARVSQRVERITEMIRTLLEEGGVTAADVDFVVLSCDLGSSKEGDLAEKLAVDRIFAGPGEVWPGAVAPKMVLGETWGASGAFGAAIAIEATKSCVVEKSPAQERLVRRAVVVDTASRGGSHLFGLLLESSHDPRESSESSKEATRGAD